MSRRLSTSVTFQNLQSRVAALEEQGLLASNVVTALGYVPANKAGDTFAGNVTFGDANFGAFFNTAIQPFIAFDNGDNLSFVRATNTFAFNIANAFQARLDSGGLFVVNPLTVGDGNFGLNFNSGAEPFYQFDSGDKLGYDRTTNQFLFRVSNNVVSSLSATALSMAAGATINASNVNVSGTINLGDTSFQAAVLASNPRITLDIGDYLQYDRTANRYNMVVGGAAQFVLDSGGATVVGTELIVANDSNFRLSMASSTQPLLRFDSGDQYLYDRAANQHKMMIGGAIKLVVDTNGLTSNGAVAAGTYVQIGDLNFFAQIASGNPQISFDSGDQLFYDRTANKFYFAIGGVNVASIDASGNMRIKGALTQGVTP